MDASASGHGLGEGDAGASTSNGSGGLAGEGGGEKDQDRTVEIRIKTLDSNPFTLRVHKDIPVLELKERVAQMTGTPVENQRLICRGKVLKDDHLLSAYNVDEGHTLHLVARRPPPATALHQQQQQNTQPSAAGESGPASDTQPRGHVSHSVLMGAINIPDTGGGFQDLNRIVSGVLNSIGLAGAYAGGGAPSAGTTAQGTGGSSAAAGSAQATGVYGEGEDAGELDGENLGPEVEVHIDTVYGLPPGFVPPPVIPVGAGGWQAPWTQAQLPSGQTPPDALTTINQYISNLNHLIATIDRTGAAPRPTPQPSTSESMDIPSTEEASRRQNTGENLPEAAQAPVGQVRSDVHVGSSDHSSSSGQDQVITSESVSVVSMSSSAPVVPASAVVIPASVVALPTSTATVPASAVTVSANTSTGGQVQAPEMATSGVSTTRVGGVAAVNREQPISELLSAIRGSLELMRGPGGSAIARFADQLAIQGPVNEPEARNNFRVQAMQQGTIMQRLGALLLELGRVTFSLMWQAPGREGFINPGPAVYISNDHAQPIMVQPVRQYRPQIPFFNPAQAGNSQGNIAIHIHANGPEIQLPPRSPAQGAPGPQSAGVGATPAPAAGSGGQGPVRQGDGQQTGSTNQAPAGPSGNEADDGRGGAPGTGQGGMWLGPGGEAMQAIFCSIDANGQLTVQGRGVPPGTAGAGQSDAAVAGQSRPGGQGQSLPQAPNMGMLPPQAVFLPAAALAQMWRPGPPSPTQAGPPSQSQPQPGAAPPPQQNRPQVQMQAWGPPGSVARRPFGISAVSFSTGTSPSPSSVSVFAPPFMSPRAGGPAQPQGEQRPENASGQGQAPTSQESMDHQQTQQQQQQSGASAGTQISDFAARSVMSIMETIMAGLRPPSSGEAAVTHQAEGGAAVTADASYAREARDNPSAAVGAAAASGGPQGAAQASPGGVQNPTVTGTEGHPQGVDPAAVMSSIFSALQPFMNIQQQGHYQVHLGQGLHPQHHQQQQQQQRHQQQQQRHQQQQQQHHHHHQQQQQQQQQNQQQHRQQEQHDQRPEQTDQSQQSGSLLSREQDDSQLISRQAEDPSHGVARMDTTEAPLTMAAPVSSERIESTAQLPNEPQPRQAEGPEQHSGLVAAVTSSNGSSALVLDGLREAAQDKGSHQKSRNDGQPSGELQSTSVKDERSHADPSPSARNHPEQGAHAPNKEGNHSEAELRGRESAKQTPPALGLGISGLSPLPARPRRRSGSHSARAARLSTEAGGADGGAHSTEENDVKVAAREMLLQLVGGETTEDAQRDNNLASCNGPESMDNDDRAQGRQVTDREGGAGRTGGQPGPPGDALGGLLGAIAGSGAGGGLGAALGGLMSSITAGDRRREGSTTSSEDASGFRDIVGQLMQSPVVDDMMMQILSGAGRGADPGSAGSRRGPGVENSTGDLANMMSQMMPMVTQMLGGIGGGAGVSDAGGGGGNVDRSRTRSQAGRSVESGGGSSRESNGLAGNQAGDAEEWKAALSKEEAAEWADTIRRDQTEQEGMILQRPLSEAYIRGSPAKRQRRGVAVEGCRKKGELGSSAGQVNSHGSAGLENTNSSELPDCDPEQRSEGNRPLETLSGRRRSRAEMERPIELEDARSIAEDLCLSLSPPGNFVLKKMLSPPHPPNPPTDM